MDGRTITYVEPAWQHNTVVVSVIFFTGRYKYGYGSVIGMTSEGGGAVAFPVMTLLLGVHPSVARDFSVMVQVRTSLLWFVFEV